MKTDAVPCRKPGRAFAKRAAAFGAALALATAMCACAGNPFASAPKSVSELVRAVQGEKYVQTVAVSHRQKYIAAIKLIPQAAGSVGEVDVIDTASGKRTKVPGVSDDDLRILSWSYDDKYLAVDIGSSAEGATYLVGIPKLDTLLTIGDNTGFIWSSDSEQIAFGQVNDAVQPAELTELTGTPQIDLYELPSLTHRTIVPADGNYFYSLKSLSHASLLAQKTDFATRESRMITVSLTGSSAPSAAASSPGSENRNYFYRVASPDFISSGTGYLCLEVSGEENNILRYTDSLMKTSDAGKTWTRIETASPPDDVAFIDERTGYGVRESTLYKTTDGGATWQSVSFFEGKTVSSVRIENPRLLFTVSAYDKPKVYRTLDGGLNWEKIGLPKAEDNIGFVEDMSWLSADEGYAYMGGGSAAGSQEKAVYYTKDAGKSWSLRSRACATLTDKNNVGTLPFAGGCGGIRFFPNGIGYIGGGTGGVMKSTDGGIRFTELFKSGDAQFGSGTGVPDFLSVQVGYGVFADAKAGYATYLDKTADGGAHWTHVVSVEDIARFAGP